MLKPHRQSKKLKAAIQALAGELMSWEGVVYRAVPTRFAKNSVIISATGSLLTGGRYNGKGIFEVLYASELPETAMAEVLGWYRDFGFDPADAMPRTFVAIDLNLMRVLDLTDRVIQTKLGVTDEALVASAWRTYQDEGKEFLTQAIGRLANEAGIEALIVPSSRNNDARNLAIFLRNLTSRSSIHPRGL